MTKKNVLVTGASRGLGLAIARVLVHSGYKVIAISRRGSSELDELCAANPEVAFSELHDLSLLGKISELVRRITTRHGRLYGLVNNAALGSNGVLSTMHDSEIIECIQTNLTSSIFLSKYAARSMLLNREGRIINISSIIATTGFNGLSVYAASKAGLVGFTRSLAREVGKAGITVNCVAPGYMQTDMTSALQGEKLEAIKRRSPLGRLATVEDAASAVLYLLGPQGTAVTGTTVTVDAGSTA